MGKSTAEFIATRGRIMQNPWAVRGHPDLWIQIGISRERLLVAILKSSLKTGI